MWVFSTAFHLAWCAGAAQLPFRFAAAPHPPQRHSSPANAVQPQIIARITNAVQTRQCEFCILIDLMVLLNLADLTNLVILVNEVIMVKLVILSAGECGPKMCLW